MSAREAKNWITHRYFRTYSIASELARIANNPDFHELEHLFIEDGVLEFTPNWKKDTLVHKFARWIADEKFINDTSGPYVVEYMQSESGSIYTKRFLPVDLCMTAYGFDSEPFEVPPPDGDMVEIRPKVSEWRESSKVADACYEYMLNDLRLSQIYHDLLARIADEVFHVVFINRVLMARLNEIISMKVREIGPETVEEYGGDAANFLRGGFRLKRTAPPAWVRRAVFHREKGRCALCRANLSPVLSSIPGYQFDHIVPISHGGLNDLTNMQLLCESCNKSKSNSSSATSPIYQKWYAE
ncbi:HNH endonuclease [Amycolatopsis sp. Poz14]|uniref:HNH endonuclease n=1 Tax=Amycolatopsis sp. Poz14 TaxID=1447705 RepID=UPI001EE97D79|nr:HNH endonuclease signature motif containing protein [Amycolatopsis sp. Poz14]MCG3754773.1 HNH endonuclease [Amycolatopsis sp. Poz14]